MARGERSVQWGLPSREKGQRGKSIMKPHLNQAVLIFLVTVALSGCTSAQLSDAGAVLDAFAPTPQEQCQNTGGQWETITAYDASGAPSISNVCINKRTQP
ncbi:MAG: hypothetical protein KGL35_17755 [Bradyrhizobium sp.]|nr:hypothetical protein [Bradyrhizobium sp.]